MATIIPTEEQETVINYDRSGQFAEVYTSDSTVMTKLDKRVEKSKDWSLVKIETCGDIVVAKTYRCPKRLISFREAITTREKREMTPEQKAKVAERLRLAREKKKHV